MAEREMCKLCPHELNGFANLGAHVNRKHGLSMEDYNAIDEKEYTEVLEDIKPFKTKEEHIEKPIDNLESKTEITGEELSKAIFNDVERKDPSRPLNVFCEENEISEGELINLVNKWKGESEIPVKEQLKNKEELGMKKASETAKKLPKRVSTYDSFEAQSLREKYGYTTVEVIGQKGATPKTYVLERKE